MVRTETMFREEQRSSAVRIPCEKVTRVRILGGQLRSTVGIGTKLGEELRSRRSRCQVTKLDTRWRMVDGHHVGEIFTTGFTRCACKRKCSRRKLSDNIWRYMVLQYTRYCSMQVICMHVRCCTCAVC
ncbi:Os04g0244201 [Oryza sativa Japonica Group]|uniref:Os04g0244201 protein n=1 Tax=Oryza sativa subsp. japonica TaxID=39947 RepID=A0A0N7KIQ1_ORYSJ|nr:Os04g0244201 [Oryza sativa Japonica Group]